LRIVKVKKPSFFVFENVPGILSPSNQKEFSKFKERLENLGYNINYQNLNAKDYGVPQDRKRIFLIGVKKELKIIFDFGRISKAKKQNLLLDCIHDLQKTNLNSLQVANHEYYEGGFSPIYMSRNRVRSWNEVSFTIQASGRHSPLHPSAFPMIKKNTDKFIFTKKNIRRLTVRECARIQTFPDNFVFKYGNLNDGYKMVGNAVPVLLANKIATELKKIFEIKKIPKVYKGIIARTVPGNIYENNSTC
jgi:DNA (cytosine-5)-methyltransferase 1